MGSPSRHTRSRETETATLLRWAPAITTVVAAAATIVAALISWTSERSATDKDYVTLAMSILSSKESSVPARRWAVDVLSRLSPVQIPKELASGLVTGRSIMPSELDPSATRREIVNCLKPVLESRLTERVEGAPLPPAGMTIGDLAVFADQQTGNLDIANARIEALTEAAEVCIAPVPPTLR